MGEFADKAKGLGNEIAGNVKQAAGHATDSPNLKAEGIAQERKGRRPEPKRQGQRCAWRQGLSATF